METYDFNKLLAKDVLFRNPWFFNSLGRKCAFKGEEKYQCLEHHIERFTVIPDQYGKPLQCF